MAGSRESLPVDDLEDPAAQFGTERMLRSVATRDVIIAGAGFSRSISDAMPLTDELGRAATDNAEILDAPGFDGGTFETWLSRLAEPQPYLTEIENLQNQVNFQRLSQAIHDVLRAAQNEVLASGMPEWLRRFVVALHYRRAAVITFNYDLLIEHALTNAGLWDFEMNFSQGEDVLWTEMLGDLPGFPPAPARLSGPLKETLSLLKLHGSLNWYWIPTDSIGTTLNFWDLEPADGDLHRYLPGRVPFVVPPASLKSSYFRSPVLRQTWQTAAAALRAADRVALLGYSLPLTDQVAAGLLSDSVRTGTELMVVNPDPGPVVKSVRRLTQIDAGVGRSIEHFASAFVDESSRLLAEQIAESTATAVPSAGLQVGWSLNLMAPARHLTRRGKVVEIHVEGFSDPTPTRSRDGRGPSVTLGALAGLTASGDTLKVVSSDGFRSVIVGIDRFRTPDGASTHWQVLVPADGHDAFSSP